VKDGTDTHINVAQLGERERSLIERIRQREPGTRNVNEEHDERLTLGDRVADRVASVIGSWRFIIVMSFVLTAWIASNVLGWVQQWDPYPFILLNLALSFQAAYAAPVIMMSQNRQEVKDRLRADQDYETNLKAELKVEEIQKKLEEVLELQRRQSALLERPVSIENRSNP
jgi:uncharacterized membrane protein